VSRDDLSAGERAALFALLGEARKVPNPELKELIGFTLVGEERRRLNERKLVESEKIGRAFVHELSDKGWRWCADELAAGPVRRGSSLERAQALVFRAFSRYLSAAGLSLADVVCPSGDGVTGDVARVTGDVGDATDVAARVQAGYLVLSPASGEFVKLRELRLRLADVPRTDLDSALATMFTTQRINLIPQENQQALSTADREAALRIGGEYKHLISIE
jgi:hypothetical protein